MNLTSILVSIIIGALAGFLAGKIVKGSGSGFLLNLIIGVIGGFIGGNLLNWIGVKSAFWGTFWGVLLTAVIGACVLLWIVSLFKKK
ncbi:MAG: GlsB/YeaQ/YmgE family stress response membrane protein [Bacteroidales bacterium]|nr:GlsB/YeaQ/YmgE family stress response membrane protein [Bacteroidales bacterium]MBR0501084.1 GlsB/YeaQ/YmgE family stress response membrane protein [Bacteroidales bacterium]